MEVVIHIVVSTVRILLGVLQLLMLARAILSWIPFENDTPLQQFLHVTTEPIILPVRNILERLNLFTGLPIDMSFFISYLLLSIISALL